MKLRYPYLHFQQIFPTSRPWNYQKLSETNYQELSEIILQIPPFQELSDLGLRAHWDGSGQRLAAGRGHRSRRGHGHDRPRRELEGGPATAMAMAFP